MDPETLKAEAEKKCQGGFFKNLLKGGPNYDEASDLFVNAANQYKIRAEWTNAAQCYQRAAELQALAGDQTREAQCLVDAGHMYKKLSTKMAQAQYDLAVSIFVQTGRFAQAAKLMKTLADDFEQEGDLEEAMRCYKKAADYFQLDEYGKSMFSQCIIKYAELLARLKGDYDAAIKIFESEGAKALKNSLVQFGAKEHFFKAGILQLAKGDVLTASIACERYEQIDPRFESSREGKLLKTLCQSCEGEDSDAFVDSLAEFDRITRLDPWKIHFFNKIKASIRGTVIQAQAAPAALLEGDPNEVDLT